MRSQSSERVVLLQTNTQVNMLATMAGRLTQEA